MTNRRSLKGLGRVATLGIVAGMRSQMPLALLSLRASRRGAGGILGHRAVAALFVVGAASELVMDKLPILPARTEPQPLAARVGMGALSGAILGRWTGLPVVAGVVTGASAASLGSYAGYHLRKSLVEATEVPDPVWAGLEDIAAISLGMLATRD